MGLFIISYVRINKSNHLGVFVNNLEKAEKYYSSLFGFKCISKQSEKVIMKNGNQYFYLIKENREKGSVIEYEVNDINKAKIELQNNGCKILKWDGKGKDCFAKDKYGMIFNIWQREERP